MSEDKEAESLPVHVAHCSERYRSIFNRLKRIEKLLYTLGLGILATSGAIIGYLVHLTEKLIFLPPGP